MALGDFFKRARQTVVGLAKKASSALVQGVEQTKKAFRRSLSFVVGRRFDEKLADELLEALIGADISPSMSEDLVAKLKNLYLDREIQTEDEILKVLKDTIKKDFPAQASLPKWADAGPTVYLIVGVNGSGKTTSIAKLAHRFKTEGKSVLLAPADTFRAAAVQQLITWAERIGVEYIPSKQGQDSASVAHQAVEKAVAKNFDLVIIDTAGRQDNNVNLMNELEKITRVIKKLVPSAPHEVLLVLDGNTGQTAVRQAKNFLETSGVTGLIITKLDGTAKGGAVISMRSEVDIPVKWIGLGEKMTDLEPFDADLFVDEIFKTREEEAAEATPKT